MTRGLTSYYVFQQNKLILSKLVGSKWKIKICIKGELKKPGLVPFCPISKAFYHFNISNSSEEVRKGKKEENYEENVNFFLWNLNMYLSFYLLEKGKVDVSNVVALYYATMPPID